MTFSFKFLKIAVLLNAGEQPLPKVDCYILFMINEHHLLWTRSFVALRIYFLFKINFWCNEETDTCFNVEYVLLGRNFDLLGCYLVVTACYLIMITTGYCL